MKWEIRFFIFSSELNTNQEMNCVELRSNSNNWLNELNTKWHMNESHASSLKQFLRQNHSFRFQTTEMNVIVVLLCAIIIIIILYDFVISWLIMRSLFCYVHWFYSTSNSVTVYFFILLDKLAHANVKLSTNPATISKLFTLPINWKHISKVNLPFWFWWKFELNSYFAWVIMIMKHHNIHAK